MALSRVALVTNNPQPLALFYRTALGFAEAMPRALPPRATGPGLECDRFRLNQPWFNLKRESPSQVKLEHDSEVEGEARSGSTSTDHALAVRLGLRYGGSEIELLAFAPPGRGFPPGQRADSLSFQHFAIVTPDIAAAYRTLRGVAGWRPISTDGPVRLPASSGGAIAFKFRDPEGHPLELLQLPEGNTPRIDHSAIVVRDTAVSLAFYRRFGLAAQGGSYNQGPAQAALDGLEAPAVQVTRLGDATGRLHLELLCYEGAAPAAPARAPNDVIATRLVFDEGVPGQQCDPDGHVLSIETDARELD